LVRKKGSAFPAVAQKDQKMTDEKKFWKIAHKTIVKKPSKQDFVKKMTKYKSMIQDRPENPQFFPFVLGTAYDAWHDGSEFGAWQSYR
tara:strand:- start:3304 stop:3567 length:264 start_codon:yes stop_codon:yes gene_type:complete